MISFERGARVFEIRDIDSGKLLLTLENPAKMKAFLDARTIAPDRFSIREEIEYRPRRIGGDDR
ncbi:MAG: hypothetical protein ISN29_00630 [Gammaproteobacteria bacterium AqS3]|nr:hypothetical protein [Gammaproteobacteria bacterium AqS3]